MKTQCRPSRVGRGWGLGIALGALLLLLGLSGTSWAQVASQGMPLSATQSGLQAPQFPASGGWGRILTVTNRWLVLENEQGQQFPVAFDSIGLFVMRWPTSPSRIAPTALIEVTGLDIGSQRVQTSHVDVYDGTARNMVTPAYLPVVGYGRVLTPFDWEEQNNLGINYHYSMLPGEERMPARLHVVGPPASTFPLTIGIPGNTAVAVVPMPSGLTMTQITEGAPSFVQPGDMAFVSPLPMGSTPRSLALSQLVVYKSMPMDQFGR